MTISSEVSQRIAMLRTIMIFGVVLLHTEARLSVDQIDLDNTFHVIRAFFQEGLFRATVPLLSLISGYLLFSSGFDLSPIKLYKKKIKTLALPFFFFNIVFAAAMYVVEIATGWAPWHQMTKMSEMELINAFYGISAYPINFPMYFVRDLLVVMLLVPLFGLFLRHAPTIGLLLVGAVFWSDLDGDLINRSTIPIFFYVGGLAAVRNWNLTAADRHALPCLALVLIGAAAIVAFRIMDITPFTLAAPFLIWAAASKLVQTKAGRWAQRHSKYSFFIFCAHAPLQVVPYRIYQHSPWMPEALHWFASPLICIAILIGVHRAAMRWMPKTFAFMTATRPATPAPAAAPATLVPANGNAPA